MALFSVTYPLIKKNEGFYAWLPGDAGGETYGGIARNYHGDWAGWSIVDAYKKKMGVVGTSPSNTLKNNTVIPGLEALVEKFYLDWWNGLGLSKVNSDDIAKIIFDFIVNSSSTGILETEKVLQNIFHANFQADRTFDQQTIDLINAQDAKKLFNAILTARQDFYKVVSEKAVKYTVVAGDTTASISKAKGVPLSELPAAVTPGQQITIYPNRKFLKSWLDRLKYSFTPFKLAVAGGTFITVTLAFFFARYLIKRNEKKKALNGKFKSKGR
jgi:lysozyme family protein